MTTDTKEYAQERFDELKAAIRKAMFQLSQADDMARSINHCPYDVEEHLEAAYDYVKIAKNHASAWSEWDCK